MKDGRKITQNVLGEHKVITTEQQFLGVILSFFMHLRWPVYFATHCVSSLYTPCSDSLISFFFFTIEEISVTYFKRIENLLIHAILNVNRSKCNKIESICILLRNCSVDY